MSSGRISRMYNERRRSNYKGISVCKYDLKEMLRLKDRIMRELENAIQIH